MLRILIDTNVLISALGWEGNEKELLDKILTKKYKLIQSQALLDELINVLKRPKFDYISLDKKSELLKYLTELAEMVNPKERIEMIKQDMTDNKILEAAVEGNADYIITGDEHLLNLKEFRKIRIVNAKEFLELLKDLIP